MNGYQEGAITGGIGKGINTAVSGILNLYGLQQRHNLASRFEREMGEDLSKWRTPSVRHSVPGGVGMPQANRLGVNQSIDADPRYLQPGADALLD